MAPRRLVRVGIPEQFQAAPARTESFACIAAVPALNSTTGSYCGTLALGGALVLACNAPSNLQRIRHLSSLPAA